VVQPTVHSEWVPDRQNWQFRLWDLPRTCSNDVDFSLRKNFKITERIKMQFSLDFFNLFNHPQYTVRLHRQQQ